MQPAWLQSLNFVYSVAYEECVPLIWHHPIPNGEPCLLSLGIPGTRPTPLVPPQSQTPSGNTATTIQHLWPHNSWVGLHCPWHKEVQQVQRAESHIWNDVCNEVETLATIQGPVALSKYQRQPSALLTAWKHHMKVLILHLHQCCRFSRNIA